MHAIIAALTAECCAGLPARSETAPARPPRKLRRERSARDTAPRSARRPGPPAV